MRFGTFAKFYAFPLQIQLQSYKQALTRPGIRSTVCICDTLGWNLAWQLASPRSAFMVHVSENISFRLLFGLRTEPIRTPLHFAYSVPHYGRRTGGTYGNIKATRIRTSFHIPFHHLLIPNIRKFYRELRLHCRIISCESKPPPNTLYLQPSSLLIIKRTFPFAVSATWVLMPFFCITKSGVPFGSVKSTPWINPQMSVPTKQITNIRLPIQRNRLPPNPQNAPPQTIYLPYRVLDKRRAPTHRHLHPTSPRIPLHLVQDAAFNSARWVGHYGVCWSWFLGCWHHLETLVVLWLWALGVYSILRRDFWPAIKLFPVDPVLRR